MCRVEVAPAARRHCDELAANIRPADLAEVFASGGRNAYRAVADSHAASSHSWVLLFDGRVAAVFGVVPVGTRRHCVWALTTKVVDRHRLAFMRVSRQCLPRLVRECGELRNLVDARYQGALDWLEVLGFGLGEPSPHPVTGLPFRLAAIGRA